VERSRGAWECAGHPSIDLVPSAGPSPWSQAAPSVVGTRKNFFGIPGRSLASPRIALIVACLGHRTAKAAIPVANCPGRHSNGRPPFDNTESRLAGREQRVKGGYWLASPFNVRLPRSSSETTFSTAAATSDQRNAVQQAHRKRFGNQVTSCPAARAPVKTPNSFTAASAIRPCRSGTRFWRASSTPAPATMNRSTRTRCLG